MKGKQTQENKITNCKKKPLNNNDYKLENKKMELGMLGKIFGNKDHAPINISAISIVISFLCLISIIAFDTLNGSKYPLYDKLGLPLITIITTSLGFIFGKLSEKKEEK